MESKGLAQLTFNYEGRDFNKQMTYARDLLDKVYEDLM